MILKLKIIDGEAHFIVKIPVTKCDCCGVQYPDELRCDQLNDKGDVDSRNFSFVQFQTVKGWRFARNGDVKICPSCAKPIEEAQHKLHDGVRAVEEEVIANAARRSK